MKVPKFNIGDIIWIKWEDHFTCYNGGWHTPEERDALDAYAPVYIETVGIVIFDNGKNVAVAPTYNSDDGNTNGGWSVKIKNCIVDFKVLKKAKKNK